MSDPEQIDKDLHKAWTNYARGCEIPSFDTRHTLFAAGWHARAALAAAPPAAEDADAENAIDELLDVAMECGARGDHRTHERLNAIARRLRSAPDQPPTPALVAAADATAAELDRVLEAIRKMYGIIFPRSRDTLATYTAARATGAAAAGEGTE